MMLTHVNTFSAPIDEIHHNLNHFQNILSNLSKMDRHESNIKDIYNDNYMFKLKDSSFSYWKSKSDEITDEFLYVIAPTIARYNMFQYYISDSITISTIIAYLDYYKYDVHKGYTIPRDSIWMLEEPLVKPGEMYGKKEKDWVRDALELLIYKTHFPSLKKHSNEIAEHLQKCNAPLMFKLQLLLLCDSTVLSPEMKSQYLNLIKFRQNKIDSGMVYHVKDTLYGTDFFYEPVPVWVKALLGDSTANKNIIQMYERKDQFSLALFIGNANFVWTKEMKDNFISLFQLDIPFCDIRPPERYLITHRAQSPYKICRSMQDSLLMALARHHPNDPMFSNLYSFNRREAFYCEPEKQLPYFDTLAIWLKRNYNFTVDYNKFKPYFKKDTSKDQSAIRDLCNKKQIKK